VGDVIPKRRQVGSAGKYAGHADDGYRRWFLHRIFIKVRIDSDFKATGEYFRMRAAGDLRCVPIIGTALWSIRGIR
jgi:hypothetical protein